MRWALAVAVAACGHSSTATSDAGSDGSSPTASYDVVVVGAGTGGTSAAIAASRHGAKVLLVEESGWVGGQMASVPTIEDARFASPANTGFIVDVQAAIAAYYAGIGHADDPHFTGQPSAEPEVVRDFFVQALSAAGVTVELRTAVTSVQTDGTTVTGVTLGDGTVVASHVVIDATELGDVLPLAGAEYRVGNQISSQTIDPTACVQSITYVAPIRKYVDGVPSGFAIATAPMDYDAVPTGAYNVDPAYATTIHAGFASYVAAVATQPTTSAYPWSWAEHNLYRAVPDSAGLDYTYPNDTAITRTSANLANDYPPAAIVGAAGMPSGTMPVGYIEDRTARAAFDCAAKLFTLEFIYFAQHDLALEDGEAWSVANDETFDAAGEPPACPNIPAELAPLARELPPTPYVRESRRIVAVHTLTGTELARATADPNATGSAFHTAVARGWYMMDLHHCNSVGDLESDLGDDTVATTDYGSGGVEIPFESLVPIAVDGLLAAEKNIGVSRLANGTTRLEGATLLTGEAAGVIAALATMHSIQPRAVDPFEVQRALIADGVGLSLAEYSDVLPSDARWAAVQLVATRGLLVGTSPTTFAPDAQLTRAQAAVALSRVFQLSIDPPTTSDFSDVLTTDPAYPYIEAFYMAHLTAGCGGGDFCPASPVQRAQLAVFIAKGLNAALPPCATAPFPDVLTTDPACPAIAYVTANGLMADCGGGLFCPTDDLSRGDVASPLVAIMIAIGAPP